MALAQGKPTGIQGLEEKQVNAVSRLSLILSVQTVEMACIVEMG